LSQAQQLYQLQNLDSELDQTREQLADITAALGESEALKKAKQAVETAEQELRQAQTKAQDLDLEVGTLANKIVQQEKLLYSGKVSSAKEAANLQEEVASLKRWHQKREEALLEAMVAAEEAEERFDQAQEELATVSARWQANQAELTHKQGDLERKSQELMARRPALAEKIDADELRNYEALRRKKGGRAVALVKNGVCQGCGVTASNSKVQQARTGAALSYCSTCGRILYVP
jgi:hypothetical protein